MMTVDELILLNEQLAICSYYLEFGSGNSTISASKLANIKKASIVESDKTFINNNILPDPNIKEAIDKKRLEILYVNIGETKEWGYPIDDSRKKHWPEYSLIPFLRAEKYDLVFVDGRFRVACILQACLHLPAGTKILIHDFYNRLYYHIVLLFIEEIKKADTMGLFVIKPHNNRDLIIQLLELYQYSPDC